MLVFDGQIAQGKSKGKLRQYEIIHYQAMVDSGSNLAPDLKEATAPILAKLNDALKREEDSKKWRREVADLKMQFSHAMYDVADQRQKVKYPEIMAKPESERKLEEQRAVDTIPNAIEDEVIDATYAKHPNWQRVKHVYAQAKADILANINEFSIPAATKKALTDKVAAAELTLPYTSDNGLDAEDACASTTINAYYFPSRNELVVCGGLFNAFQSESALYFVLAHELGHSIDTSRQAKLDYQANSPLYQRLQSLRKTGDISCADWKKAKEEAFVVPKEFVSRAESRPLEKLIACLKDRSKLKELNTSEIRSAVERVTATNLAWYADNNQFLRLAQPTITEEGKVRDNPYYMKPELFSAYLRPPFSDGKSVSDVGPREIFTQELLCQVGTKDGQPAKFIEITDKTERARLFKQALDQTSEISKSLTENKFTYCGRTCPELVPDRLAADTNENAADWQAFRATYRYLQRNKNPAQRREAAALSTSLFCDEPGAKNDAPELAVLEKELSQESHPDNRIRRISLFNQEIGGLLGCGTNPDAQGFSQCSP